MLHKKKKYIRIKYEVLSLKLDFVFYLGIVYGHVNPKQLQFNY